MTLEERISIFKNKYQDASNDLLMSFELAEALKDGMKIIQELQQERDNLKAENEKLKEEKARLNIRADEKTNTFSSDEDYLVFDFEGINNCTFKTGHDCTLSISEFVKKSLSKENKTAVAVKFLEEIKQLIKGE